MGQIVGVIERKPNEHVIQTLEAALEEAKSGNLVEVIVVGSLADQGAYFDQAAIEDRWRLIGACEYAKHAVWSAGE